MKLASGFAPVQKLLDAGVNVALGTDGMASNNNHDLFQDMYLMGTIYKGHELDPAIISPKQVIAAATRGGALAQGREDCGLVKVGMKADLTVLDTTGASWCPMTNPEVNIVFSGHGSDVVLTMCDGEVVYRDGRVPGYRSRAGEGRGLRSHEAHHLRALRQTAHKAGAPLSSREVRFCCFCMRAAGEGRGGEQP